MLKEQLKRIKGDNLQEENLKLEREKREVRMKVDELEEQNKEQVEKIKMLEKKNTKLGEQLRRVKEETAPEYWQNKVLQLKKNENLGYSLENFHFHRIMYVFSQKFSSVSQLVASLLVCFVKMKRGDYGERQLKTEGEEDASKKRKMAQAQN